MTELRFASALEMARLLRARKISAKELLEVCLDQYALHNDTLNAIVVTDLGRAKHAAMASDKRLKRGSPLGPFDGVPMTAKESFDWKGTPSTWGEPAYKENIATSDAVAITRLTAAGAVIYGKTNVPLMLADWQSFNDVYGTTNNPWDVTRSPGGSSGGSAVALASGMSALEIGSDIGASLRNPAHYCGVYSHKPTYGVVPYRGHLLSNVPLMLADWQSFNDVYGTTNNPWDVTRSPGGSSGGSAVALASGMSALEIGSDIGASLRNPAHYCGVYSHKPTYGVVPYRGHLLSNVQPSDISVAGPMARSAKDLTAMLKLLAGTDGIEARGMSLHLPDLKQKTFKDFRVAVMLSDPVSEVDQPVQDLIAKLAQFLAKKVKKISHEARPGFTTREAMDVFIAMLRSATSRKQSKDEFEANEARVENFAADDDSYYAKMTRAYVMPHRSWLMINERRHQMRLLWDRFFDDWDVMICPAAASAAFPHDHVGDRHERSIEVNGKRVPTTDQLFWAGYSCGFYLPSTVAPIGLTPQGLPSGVQIITRQYGDYTSLRFAELLEKEYASFVPPPGY